MEMELSTETMHAFCVSYDVSHRNFLHLSTYFAVFWFSIYDFSNALCRPSFPIEARKTVHIHIYSTLLARRSLVYLICKFLVV